MPDITVTCPDCGREYQISEYATIEGLACHTCGASLSRPHMEAQQGLQLRKETPYTVPAAAAPADAGGPVVHPAPVVAVHHEEVVKESPKWLPWFVLLVVAGIFIGFQYKAEQFGTYTVYYTWGRNILTLLAYASVVLVAFQDSLGPGALCLLLPPYMLVYAGSSVESGVLRGLLFGITLTLVAETFLFPEQSLFVAMGGNMSELIDTVDGLIVKASDSPLAN